MLAVNITVEYWWPENLLWLDNCCRCFYSGSFLHRADHLGPQRFCDSDDRGIGLVKDIVLFSDDY